MTDAPREPNCDGDGCRLKGVLSDELVGSCTLYVVSGQAGRLVDPHQFTDDKALLSVPNVPGFSLGVEFASAFSRGGDKD